MGISFLHGIETIEYTGGGRPIQTVKSSVIGIIGTAPNADPIKFPLNKPVLCLNPRDIEGLGLTGTLPRELETIFAKVWAWTIVIRVAEGQSTAETMSNVLGSSLAMTGLHAFRKCKSTFGIAPRILIAPGFTSTRPNTGLASVAVTDGGENYTTVPSVTFGGGGAGAILPTGRAVISNGEVTNVLIDFPGFNLTAPVTVALSGGGGTGATATATIGQVRNPVVSQLDGFGKNFRAVVITDGPGTTRDDAVTYRNDWGSDRIFIVDPMGVYWDRALSTTVTRPVASSVAALIAWLDNERGFWWSPSNQELQDVLGPARPIDWMINGHNTEANYLNEMAIATIINHKGVRLWGNRTTATDPLWAFLSVRRTADMIYESIEDALLWAMDRPILANSILEIQESGRAYMKYLVRQGALVGGDMWLDASENPPIQLQAGNLVMNMDLEPPAPLERLTFKAYRNADYYEEVTAAAIRMAA